MTKATGIAMPAAPIDRNDYHALKGVIVTLLASIVLAACGGGAATTENPITSVPNPGDAPYTGPVARDADVLKFQQEFWSNAKTSDRCGSCHNESVAQIPMFVRNDDVNMAYDAAIPVVDTQLPSASQLVAKVGGGHNCWVEDAGVCASIMTTWIENWVGATAGGGRQIVLTPPASVDPGDSKNFPVDAFTPGLNGANTFASTIYPIVEQYCSNCHSSEAANAIQPYFADPDINSAYDAAKPKINLDAPANSRLVLRLRVESHNCWDNCPANAQQMEDAIIAFANFDPTPVDQSLVYSKALRLIDGTLASGGNRYEDAQVALWEFKTGQGFVAYDTSGVDPAIDLNLSPEVTWYGGWGITMNGGRAQGLTTPSKKLYDVLQESGEFSIEAWVIPANVTQEAARIVSYSANDQNRNFTLQQNLYDYQFRLRMGPDTLGNPTTNLNGDEALSTPAMDEVLQATLQHVVATFNPIDGRRIYVNGELVSNTDPVGSGNFVPWQDTFALVLGSEASGEGRWEGTVRLAAIHRRALTQEQVVQNFDVGVGEKFFMLFDISERIGAPIQTSYILFEVQQYDSYAYLFDRPHFITLDGSTPEGIPIEGIRVAMNGLEVAVGQTYATLVDTLSASEFVELGQPLSTLGAVLPLEKGPEDDEFFLTFDTLDQFTYQRDPYPTLVITENDLPPAPRIGIKTFDEIDATYAEVTGVRRENFPAVDMTYQELRQSLPAVEDINTFLSSQQVAIAQLAIEYCNALVNVDGDTGSGSMFPGFNFDAAEATAFAVGNRDLFVNPLIDNIMGAGLTSQPAFADVYSELASFQAAGGRPDNLIDRLVAGTSNTRAIAKGVCAAMLGNAVTLVQ
ncbi:MAG: LamG domain-containing protein [Gammaproteobacteria bacterium]|nr:LamG domain-containing protein [Gammaproteobacteria bacterium]